MQEEFLRADGDNIGIRASPAQVEVVNRYRWGQISLEDASRALGEQHAELRPCGRPNETYREYLTSFFASAADTLGLR